MVLLPHGIVRGAAQVDEELLRAADIGIKVAHPFGIDLFVVDAADHQGRRGHRFHFLLGPAPARRGDGRTPHAGFQLAPAGSDFSISVHTEAAACGSYWPGQGAWRFQLARNSSWFWVLNAAPATGSTAGAPDLAARL